MSEERLISTTDRFLRMDKVRNITGRSRTRIYEDPTFPRPIKLGLRESAWLESEVLEWMQERIRASRPASQDSS